MGIPRKALRRLLATRLPVHYTKKVVKPVLDEKGAATDNDEVDSILKCNDSWAE